MTTRTWSAHLAVAAGIAIENARLHQHVREVAVFEERDRLARDLHDTVIQRLFGAGLRLQGIAGAVREADIARRMGSVVTEIDESITQLRSIIYALGLAGGERGHPGQDHHALARSGRSGWLRGTELI